jgi:hypothetical protein
MKLVFYSGGDNKINEKLDLGLIELIGKKILKSAIFPRARILKQSILMRLKTTMPSTVLLDFYILISIMSLTKANFPNLYLVMLSICRVEIRFASCIQLKKESLLPF